MIKLVPQVVHDSVKFLKRPPGVACQVFVLITRPGCSQHKSAPAGTLYGSRNGFPAKFQ
jgi:hypothetical protein